MENNKTMNQLSENKLSSVSGGAEFVISSDGKKILPLFEESQIEINGVTFTAFERHHQMYWGYHDPISGTDRYTSAIPIPKIGGIREGYTEDIDRELDRYKKNFGNLIRRG
jgi:bacteriocin-like protein